jgi:transposase
MTRSGNRQLNAALHGIAITQIRLTGSAGHAYYRKRIATGDSSTEALRCLKHRLARVVFTRLRADHHQPDQASQTAA